MKNNSKRWFLLCAVTFLAAFHIIADVPLPPFPGELEGGGGEQLNGEPPDPGEGGGGGGTNLPPYPLYDVPGVKIAIPVITNGGSNLYFTIFDHNPADGYDLYSVTNLLNTNTTWMFIQAGGVGITNYTIVNSYTNTNSLQFWVVGNQNDSDQDGLSDGYEALVLHTNPFAKDTDGDGMPDGWEVAKGLNPLTNDANGNPDGDAFVNSLDADPFNAAVGNSTITISKPTNAVTIN